MIACLHSPHFFSSYHPYYVLPTKSEQSVVVDELAKCHENCVPFNSAARSVIGPFPTEQIVCGVLRSPKEPLLFFGRAVLLREREVGLKQQPFAVLFLEHARPATQLFELIFSGVYVEEHLGCKPRDVAL